MDQAKSLQMISNLKLLMKMLCEIKNERLNIKSFKIFAKEKYGLGDSSCEDYFYGASKYDFLYKKGDSYFVSPLVKIQFCNIYEKEGFNDLLKKKIFKHLFSKEKLFQIFIKNISSPKKLDDIPVSNIVSRRIMKNWAMDLDVISENTEHELFLLNYHKIDNITMEVFWNGLKKSYEILTKPDSHLIQDLFVKIPLMRSTVQSIIGFTEPEMFDDLLVKLLSCTQYRLKVELSGVPIIYLKNELKRNRNNLPFNWNGVSYYFIAINI